jgi:hypothetical protein
VAGTRKLKFAGQNVRSWAGRGESRKRGAKWFIEAARYGNRESQEHRGGDKVPLPGSTSENSEGTLMLIDSSHTGNFSPFELKNLLCSPTHQLHIMRY